MAAWPGDLGRRAAVPPARLARTRPLHPPRHGRAGRGSGGRRRRPGRRPCRGQRPGRRRVR
ncbi:hypothetical protein GCU49_21055, partial [Modestobacter roseus]|nr:hypothetical protein [Modestobacter roseus]